MTLGLLVTSENVHKQTNRQDSCFISMLNVLFLMPKRGGCGLPYTNDKSVFSCLTITCCYGINDVELFIYFQVA